jgi:poly-gamma-glutamate capsule biosynthesis protein CapA/YwtB (metallophosphatase superfamily)
MFILIIFVSRITLPSPFTMRSSLTSHTTPIEFFCLFKHQIILALSFILLSPLILSAQDSSTTRLSIVAVGDMMIGTNFPSDDYLPPLDGAEIFSQIKTQLSDADVTFGNLEGVILTGDYPTTKKCQDPKNCYAFKMPDHYVAHFKDAGFDVLSIANNHINDFGERGIRNTTKLLQDAGIHFAGVTDYPQTIFQVNGLKIGFCAFSPNRGTVRINDLAVARQIVQDLESKVDIVVVSFHGGGEGLAHQHITKQTEYYLGENRGNPYQFARDMIDAGADVILGHGPHVTRAIDLYKNKFIAYSLGNFSTYARFNLQGEKGISPLLNINVDENGDFVDGKIVSIKLIGEGIPVIDSTHQALLTIQNLISTDLGDIGLVLDKEGRISLKE